MAEPDPISEEEFRRLCDFLYRRTGMVFTEAKRYYVQRRVTDRMAATGATSFASYFARLRGDLGGEIEQFVNAFTVNETYFYREDHQLRCLSRNLLDERLAARSRTETLRIWSIPCSHQAKSRIPIAHGSWRTGRRSTRTTSRSLAPTSTPARSKPRPRKACFSTRQLMRLSPDLVAKHFAKLEDEALAQHLLDDIRGFRVRFAPTRTSSMDLRRDLAAWSCSSV